MQNMEIDMSESNLIELNDDMLSLVSGGEGSQMDPDGKPGG
jgi:bacteriocin-like protein